MITEQRRWKDGMVGMVCAQGYTAALTLAWNRDLSVQSATNDLKALHALIDRAFLGCRFHKKPTGDRTKAVFVFESIGSHIHVHSQWAVTPARMSTFFGWFPGNRAGLWNRLVPSGSYKLDLISNRTAFANYMLKGQHMGSDPHEIVWSDHLF